MYCRAVLYPYHIHLITILQIHVRERCRGIEYFAIEAESVTIV